MSDTRFEPLSLDTALRQSASYLSHARSCKKHLDACKPCKLAIAWYASLPLLLIADVLADRSKPHRA